MHKSQMKSIREQLVMAKYLIEGDRRNDVGLIWDLERASEGRQNRSKTLNLNRFFFLPDKTNSIQLKSRKSADSIKIL